MCIHGEVPICVHSAQGGLPKCIQGGVPMCTHSVHKGDAYA